MANLIDTDETWGTIRGKLNLNTRRRPLTPTSIVYSHTGNTTHTALVTYTLAAGLVEAHDVLECYFMVEYPNDASTKQIRWFLGGLAGSAFSDATQTTTALYQNRNYLCFPTTSSQVGFNASNQTGGMGTTGTKFTGSKDMTVSQDLVLSVLLNDATDTVTLHSVWVDLLKA